MSNEHDPRMHTAEHVINQTMIRLFGCGRSYSMHLEPRKGRVDYAFARDLTDVEFTRLAETVNAKLAEHLPVTERFMRVDEAAQLMDVGKLPEHLAHDPAALVRVVSVGGYDVCPCSGAHVDNTAAVGGVLVTSRTFTPPAEPVKAAEAGTPEAAGRLRVRFTLQAGNSSGRAE